jgi:hypothetical protein
MLQVIEIHLKFSTYSLLYYSYALLEICGWEIYFCGFTLMIIVLRSAVYLMIMCTSRNRLCLIGCCELMCLCWSQDCEDGYKYLSKKKDGIPDPLLFEDLGLAGVDLPYHDDRSRDNLCNTKHLFDMFLPRLRNIRKNHLMLFSKSLLSSKKTIWAYFHPKMVLNKPAGGCYPKVSLLKYIFYFLVKWLDVLM